jgi:hypothetical protein
MRSNQGRPFITKARDYFINHTVGISGTFLVTKAEG